MAPVETIPILLGPTAAGKSAVAVALAERLGGELISADARAVYRGLDIGTAKPAPAQRARVPHHLIDVCDPAEVYDVQRFRADVARCIAEIRARGRRPIVVGGSTLYVRALTEGLFAGPGADRALRRRLARVPLESLFARLTQVDPQAAARLQPGDRVRITRALEVFEQTGVPISALQPTAEPLPHAFAKFGLSLDRAQLYARIERRVEAMLAAGLIEEARALRPRLSPERPAFKTIGYQELFAHFEGRCTLEEAVARIKQHTRNYAKRQLTWHRRDAEIVWFDAADAPAESLAAAIAARLAGA